MDTTSLLDPQRKSITIPRGGTGSSTPRARLRVSRLFSNPAVYVSSARHHSKRILGVLPDEHPDGLPHPVVRHRPRLGEERAPALDRLDGGDGRRVPARRRVDPRAIQVEDADRPQRPSGRPVPADVGRLVVDGHPLRVADRQILHLVRLEEPLESTGRCRGRRRIDRVRLLPGENLRHPDRDGHCHHGRDRPPGIPLPPVATARHHDVINGVTRRRSISPDGLQQVRQLHDAPS